MQLESEKDNNKLYIQLSKTNIDNLILINQYKNAFTLLIMVLERLDNNDKIELINYFSKQLFDPMRGFDPIEDINFYRLIKMNNNI